MDAASAASAALVLGRKPEVRRVEFSSPGEPPAIYWVTGHRVELFMAFNEDLSLSIHASEVKQGWASRKLSLGGMYLSDSPLENFEPITYWIPADHMEVTL